jgi:ATP-grasp ribosomal peptide maturase
MALNKVVLVLTQQTDFHADMVIDELNRRKVNLIRFDTSDFPLRSTLIAQNRTGTWDGTLEFQNRLIHFDQIASIWYRRPTPFEFDPTLTPSGHQFASAEARMAIGGILRSIDCFWVNHPEKMVTADYKPLQLKLASSCGLEIPPSLITNDPDAVVRFFEDCKGEVIYKTLSGGMTLSETGNASSIYTSRVTVDDLREIQRVRHTACLFQGNVPKRVELRITIIGAQVFTAEIYSQHSEKTATDWRASYQDLSYGRHQLPAEIRDKCLAITQQLGLAYAAIDMILTPDDKYVFLEINPNGQWGWIEHATGLPLCGTLVDLLTKQAA